MRQTTIAPPLSAALMTRSFRFLRFRRAVRSSFERLDICISANVTYCITCTLCKKIYVGETGRRLTDRFREHLRDVEKKRHRCLKTSARHFNLPNHSHHNMTICGLSLHYGNTESRKNLEQKFIFQLGTLYPHGVNERLSSINLFTNSRHPISTNSKAPSHTYKPTTTTIPLFAPTKG